MARPLLSWQPRRSPASQAAQPGLLATAAAFAVVALLSASVSVDAAPKSNEYIEDTDRFPGWKGELPQQQPLGGDPITIGYGESGKVCGQNSHSGANFAVRTAARTSSCAMACSGKAC